MVVPARGEVVRRIVLIDVSSPTLVDSQEICKGNLVPRTILNSSTPLVRVVNTPDDVVTVKNDCLITDSLDGYDVYVLEAVKQDDEPKVALRNILKNSMPAYVQNKLLPFCEDFSDIFALESDKMTVNSFYKQKLRLRKKRSIRKSMPC